jgi:hypothetical protein
VITPRATRLVRTADPGGFRAALVSLACDGSVTPHSSAVTDPLAARDRMVIVPTRAAAAHLLRSIENSRLGAGGAIALPEFVTPSELPQRFAERLPTMASPVHAARREVLLGVACRTAVAAGAAPPFRLRPGLIAEILRFYDTLRRHRRDVETFTRLALGMLEPGAEIDRGAERLVTQTRFLSAAFREFEARSAALGWVDEHLMRRAAVDTAAPRPWRHVIVAVGDRSRDQHGLFAADWDLLARVPGLEQLDVVVTDMALAGAFHERVHDLLPGIEEMRIDAAAPDRPRLRVPAGVETVAWVARDREEEVATFARWARDAVRDGEIGALDEMALVVRQPLPYVYLAREVLRSAGVPCQTFDALPLAGEPYAAALDLVFAIVSGNFARVPSIALLRSPHFRFLLDGDTVMPAAIAALDRGLSDAGYLGDVATLEPALTRATESAQPAGRLLLAIAGELAPLRTSASVASHLDRLIAFLAVHENLPGPDDPLRTRQLRARAAVLGILGSLRDAYRELDDSDGEFDAVAALVRRWIEAHTFSPRTGDAGVHLVDAESARFGDFTCVQLAGLVDGEWPERPRRNVFYSPAILRELGWPAESERLDGTRAAFADLLVLPARAVAVSTFSLEDDAVVAASTLLDEAAGAGLDHIVAPDKRWRIFDHEALGMDPVHVAALSDDTKAAAQHRLEMADADPARYRGLALPPEGGSHGEPRAYSLSAVERYQDCPFKFFAQDVLRLEETPEDETSLSPRARGRFIHEVFQCFFAVWTGTVTPDRFDEARALFERVATELLARLPESDAALERTRLLGSAISTGIVDVVLGLEAARPVTVAERWLEYRLEGEFTLGGSDGRAVALKGVADRIDLLDGNRLRIIDYKSGYAPNAKRALQVPIYALCAQERLSERDGSPWQVDEASYIAFTGKRSLVSVVRADASDRAAPLAAARSRLLDVLDGVGRGEFPVKPHDPMMCSYCAFASVCRKDYVGDE